MHFSKILLIICLLLVACQNAKQKEGLATDKEKPIFKEKLSATTGITFSNDLKADLGTLENLFDFDYFYNGAGVGIADINNDGLPDIFFAGNQVDNRLYLNEGNLSFKDITENSGINTNKQWSNGVTFVDVNMDGFLDIYVTQGGPFKEFQRSNLLLVNQGDLTFVEKAAQYGLADQGIGTQSAFADFDLDGDLDCIVMNEAELYGYSVEQFLQKAYSNKETLIFNSSHIYKNDDGKYVDVSEEAGLLTPSFGLGLLVGDYNEDGLPDIYMANDYYLPDRLYYNKGNWQFTESHKSKSNQMSFFGMGVDAGDINNDGHEDLFILDMASSDHYRSKTLMASMDVDQFNLLTRQLDFGYQYMFNSLLLNDGNHNYNNIAHLAGVGLTDWSWAGLIEDYNSDGQQDILVTNGYRKYGTDNDFKNKVVQAKKDHTNNVPVTIKEKLYTEMPEEKLKNILFLNNSKLKFSQASEAKSGIRSKTYSNGAATADLDNDGDLDVVINNIDDQATVLENLSAAHTSWLTLSFATELQDKLPTVSLYSNGLKLSKQVRRTRGYMSACQPIVHFGLNSDQRIDSIKILIDTKSKTIKDVKPNQTLSIQSLNDKAIVEEEVKQLLFEKKSIGELKLFTKHNENAYEDFQKEILLPYKQGNTGPFLNRLKSSNDSEQLMFGNSIGASSALFDITDDRLSKESTISEQLTGEITAAAASDLNKDGVIDYLIGTGDNSFSSDSDNYLNYILMSSERGYSKTLLESKSITGDIVTADFDKDGYDEVLIGNRIVPQQYPIAAPLQYYDNDNGTLRLNQEKSADFSSVGIVNDMQVSDINQDGWLDLVIAAEWEPIRIFVNTGGKLKESDLNFSQLSGWWFSIEEVDINQDKLPDFIVGNLGNNTKYKADAQKPLKIFADDFDNSGSLDIVLSKKYKDDFVPLRGKECSSQQMPFVSEKFQTYDLFASATLEDVYGSMRGKYQKVVNEFRHHLLINKGGGKFESKPLAQPAQITPFMSMVKYDLNNDGHEDIIAGGNIYATEAETPRLDYNSLVLLMSNGKDNYDVVFGSDYGITLSGAAKNIEIISNSKGDYLVVGINNKVPELYKINKSNF